MWHLLCRGSGIADWAEWRDPSFHEWWYRGWWCSPALWTPPCNCSLDTPLQSKPRLPINAGLSINKCLPSFLGDDKQPQVPVPLHVWAPCATAFRRDGLTSLGAFWKWGWRRNSEGVCGPPFWSPGYGDCCFPGSHRDICWHMDTSFELAQSTASGCLLHLVAKRLGIWKSLSILLFCNEEAKHPGDSWGLWPLTLCDVFWFCFGVKFSYPIVTWT